jgi:hypothetical protein
MVSAVDFPPYLPRAPGKWEYPGCGQLCRIIAPLYNAESPPKSIGGREEVSLSPVRCHRAQPATAGSKSCVDRSCFRRRRAASYAACPFGAAQVKYLNTVYLIFKVQLRNFLLFINPSNAICQKALMSDNQLSQQLHINTA